MQKPATCVGCPLHSRYDCGSFIHPEGSGALGVLIVGESAGPAEAYDGLPFRPYAESGSVLERVWGHCGWARDQFRVTNAIRCRPPGKKLEGDRFEFAAIEHCRQYLNAEIETFKPGAILALGGTAARILTGMSGPKQGIQSIRGFPIRSRDHGIPVIPSLHPSFLRQGKMSWLGLLIRDMQLAVQVARSGMKAPPEANYLGHATVEELAAFRDEVRRNPELLLAFDIETDYSHKNDENDVVGDGSNIVLVQFSLRPGTGLAVPWQPAFIPIIQEILATENQKVGHNSWMFDIPMLASHGVTVEGLTDDSMWAWHHLQPDLPRGLQSVASLLCPEFGPWKHESGMDLNRYGCKDVDILQHIWPAIQRDLNVKDLWRGYNRHVKQLWPILKRMSEHGLPISEAEQQSFKVFLEDAMATVDVRLQAAYPEALKGSDPKLGFARTPKDTTGMVQREFIVPTKRKVPCHCVTPDGEVLKLTPKCAGCKGRGLNKVPGDPQKETRWARLLPFKPSPQQLIRYMRARGHKVPKAIGKDKDSTAKLFMERLAKDTKDPFYVDNLEYRGYQKMLGTYMWAITPRDGWNFVHAKFTYSPATGQLAATEPNVLTIPSPKGKKESIGYKLATQFRKTIVPPPGFALLEIDYSGFHTSTFALEAQDPDYFRLANKIGDPHSFLAAVMLHQSTPEQMLAMPDDELLAFLAGIKKNHKALRDGQAKPGILGYALGLGGNKLYELNRWDGESGFKSKREAEETIQTLRRVFPKGYEYQKSVRLQAHMQRFLKNRHGYIRWFWDVLHHDPQTREVVPGEQAEAAIAFNVQADAHGHLKDALLRMEAQGWLSRYGLCNVVHDSVVFMCRLELLEEALANVVGEMERPSDVLIDPVLCPDGLVVKVEASIGWNRAEMKPPGVFLESLKGAK